MPGAARLCSDRCNLNGTIITGACSVLINNKPAARIGDICAPHFPYKGLHKKPQPIMSGSCSVIVEGRPLSKLGDRCLCGCRLNIGSCDVMVGG